MGTDKSYTTAHPFNRGYQARLDGLSEYDDPFPSGDWQRNAWQHGWDKADEDMEDAESV